MARPGSFDKRGPAESSDPPPTRPPVGLRLHLDHAFGGMEIVDVVPRAIVARCECGAVIDVAEAALATCPECRGAPYDCKRCGGTGEIVDHAALEWRRPEQWRERYGGVF
jgi:hypothetical protein